MTDNLNDVFNDSKDSAEPEKIEAETGTQGETDNKSESAEAAESKVDAEPPSAENKEEVWTKKAVLDERKKRQALENELAELKKAKPKGENEDAKPAELSLEDRLWQERTLTLREIFLEKHEDYEEMESVFVDMCKENPALQAELRNSVNPAKFAYNQAKTYTETKKLSDPDYIKNIREEIRKEVLAELQGKSPPEDKRKKTALSVANLSNATHTNTNSSTVKLSTLNEMFD